MTEAEKQRRFEKIIWSAYKDNENYDKLRHKIMRIRTIMLRHELFKSMSANNQFDLSLTIACIALHTSQKDLRRLQVLNIRDKNEVFEYSIDEGYVPPTTLTIKSKKLIA